ncbi:MAG TPA: acyl-CoA dehydrogenase family protein [Dehalococcoidia bacterium]|nr:acyl-CoA dehydrogenase family protein [Dehalococcoidia bacterium]
MDFTFTPEEESFRAEVRAFVREHWGLGDVTSGIAGESDEDFERGRVFERQLAERGWLTMAWPKEYGGQAADQVQQLIFREEAAVAGAPLGQGATVIAPAIMLHGTEEQKRRFLPPIARAEIAWCQGFSEPGSGSDLASLQTRAVRDGDDYVINGQKIWTTGAFRSDWIHLLARTDPDAPKHRGISYFLFDMKTPGVSVRRLTHLTGRADLCETFFDNVRVPANQMLGPENRGWYVALTTLDFERSGIDRVVSGQRVLDAIVAHVRARQDGASDGVRALLAELQIALNVGRLLCYRVAWMQARGLVPNHEASMSKVYGSELNQRIANAGTRIMGMYGQLYEGEPRAPAAGFIAFAHLHAVQATILAGTSEIQRNVIATRGLGLPRG